MEEFRIITEIIYKNNKFYVLINHTCQKYFLKELEGGALIYPTLEEFKELYNLFNKTNINSYPLFKKDDKKVQIEPKVIYKVGKRAVLITLAAAMTMITYYTAQNVIMDHKIAELNEQISYYEQLTIKDMLEERGYKLDAIERL